MKNEDEAAPLVTVIIPNYNHGRYLNQRIESVISQSFQDYEIIILDDCSSDNSLAIIEEYRGHPKVKSVILNEVNSGSTFRQWEKGLAFSEGKLIWIAESDDYADKKFLQEIVKAFHTEKDIVLAYTESALFLEKEGKVVKNTWGKWLHEEKWNNCYTNDGSMEIASVLVYLNSILNASAVVFKREALLKVDFSVVQKFKYAGDWLVYSHLLKAGSLAYINTPLNYFRVHSKSTRNNKNFQEELERYNEIFAVIQQNRKVAIKAYGKLKIENYDWLFTEWVTKKSEKMNEKVQLFKILPFFLKIPFAKFLISFYFNRVSKMIKL